MSLRRIAIIFDNRQRTETTGRYVRRALAQFVREGRLGKVEHLLPDEMDRIPAGRFDLFLLIDDGLRYDVPKALRPVAWWAIDTHLDFARTLKRAWESDFLFTAQRPGTSHRGQDPIGNDPRRAAELWARANGVTAIGTNTSF